MSGSSDPEHARPCRVVVVHADRRVRQSLAALVGLGPDLVVVGTAARADDALAEVRATAADLVIVDPRLPDEASGLRLLQQLRVGQPSLAILLVRPADPSPALEAGFVADEVVSDLETPAGILDVVARLAKQRGCDEGAGGAPAASGRPPG